MRKTIFNEIKKTLNSAGPGAMVTFRKLVEVANTVCGYKDLKFVNTKTISKYLCQLQTLGFVTKFGTAFVKVRKPIPDELNVLTLDRAIKKLRELRKQQK